MAQVPDDGASIKKPERAAKIPPKEISVPETNETKKRRDETSLMRAVTNAFCERLIGTIHRECLDWMIPISETHLRSIL